MTQMSGEQKMYAPIAASVRGANHTRAGTLCQDALAVRQEGNLLLLAVADGLGSSSCKYSHIGAQYAVEVFSAYFLRLYQQGGDCQKLHTLLSQHKADVIPRMICKIWRKRVAEYHEEHFEEPFDPLFYASTLVGLAVCPSFYFAVQLGDGDLLLVQSGGIIERPLPTERILGTETYSLASEDAWRRMLVTVRFFCAPMEYPALFLLATDGLSNSFASDAAFQACATDYAKLIGTYGATEVAKHLPRWLAETTEGGSGDDITLALAWHTN